MREMRGEFMERGAEVQRLVGHARRKYFRGVRGVDLEDMEAEGVYWVYRNAWRYDPEKSSFSTFVCMTARSGMSMYLRGERERAKRSVDINEIIEFYGEEQDSGLEENNVRSALSEIIKGYKNQKREIAEDLLSGAEQIDIARARGVTRSYVSKIMCDISAACREKYEMVDGAMVEKDMER